MESFDAIVRKVLDAMHLMEVRLTEKIAGRCDSVERRVDARCDEPHSRFIAHDGYGEAPFDVNGPDEKSIFDEGPIFDEEPCFHRRLLGRRESPDPKPGDDERVISLSSDCTATSSFRVGSVTDSGSESEPDHAATKQILKPVPLDVFKRDEPDLAPDAYTVQSVLGACAATGALSLGLYAHAPLARELGGAGHASAVPRDVLINTSPLDLYADIDTAQTLFSDGAVLSAASTPPPTPVCAPATSSIEEAVPVDTPAKCSMMVSAEWLHANHTDPDVRHWYKDMRHSTKVKDAEGQPAFALINRATGLAIKHSLGQSNLVKLEPYNPEYLDRNLTSSLPYMLPAEKAFATAVSALGVCDKDGTVVYDGRGLFNIARGHLGAIEIFALANAGLNAKHNEAWALHYATVCDREDVTELLVQHYVDPQLKDNVLNTLHMSNCFSLIRNFCLHSFSCGWDAVPHRQPWPPPVQFVILANGVHVRPLPWPSFNSYAALVLWITSLIVAGHILPKPPWLAFDPGNLFKVYCNCSTTSASLQYALQFSLDAGNVQSQCLELRMVNLVLLLVETLSSHGIPWFSFLVLASIHGHWNVLCILVFLSLYWSVTLDKEVGLGYLNWNIHMSRILKCLYFELFGTPRPLLISLVAKDHNTGDNMLAAFFGYAVPMHSTISHPILSPWKVGSTCYLGAVTTNFGAASIQLSAILYEALQQLEDQGCVLRMVVSTYQAASGVGAAAMEELKLQTQEVLAVKAPTCNIFKQQYAFNIFSHNTPLLENVYNKEEMQRVKETRKIWNDKEVKVATICVRVPAMRAHAENVNLQIEKPLDEDTAREILRAAPGVTIINDRASNCFPTPLEVSAKDDVAVGGIRQDLSLDDNKGLLQNQGLPLYFQTRRAFDMIATILCTLEEAEPSIIVYTISGLGASRISSGGECEHTTMWNPGQVGEDQVQEGDDQAHLQAQVKDSATVGEAALMGRVGCV